jgi:hypothetical protein
VSWRCQPSGIFVTAAPTAIVIRLYSAAKYPSRLDVSIDYSMTESSADTTASSVDIGGIGAGGPGVATNTRVDANRPVPPCK